MEKRTREAGPLPGSIEKWWSSARSWAAWPCGAILARDSRMTTAGPVGTDRPFSHRFSVMNVTPTNRPNPVWLRRQASLIDLISEGDIGPSSPLTIGRLAVLGGHILVDRIEVHDDPVGAVGPEAVQAFQRRQDGVHGAGSPVELPEAFLQVLPGVRFRERREIVRRPVLLAFAHLSAP